MLETDFPKEGCGVMLGAVDGDRKKVTLAVPLENSYDGATGRFRYEIDPEDLHRADREARARGMDLIGHFPFASRLRRLFFEDAI